MAPAHPPAPLHAHADYVGGLCLDPCGGLYVVAATADGALSLLDVRMGGAALCRAVTGGAPLRCAWLGGGHVLAGAEDGALHTWDAALMSASSGSARRLAGHARALVPGPDGLYPMWHAPQIAAPVNALATLPPEAGSSSSDGGGGGGSGLPGGGLALALDDGSVALVDV